MVIKGQESYGKESTVTDAISMTLKRTGALLALAFLGACTVQQGGSYYGSGGGWGPSTGTGIRVLVMGEDSDPRTVPRRSDIFKRVLAEMKESVRRHGFRMVDEEMVAADLGWRIVERRPKTQLIQAAKLANASGTAANHVRAMMTFSIHAYRQDHGFANAVQVRIDGEMYDVMTHQFLGTFELPRAQYPAPADCNSMCITEVVGDHAREIAISLGDVLGKKLAHLAPPPGTRTIVSRPLPRTSHDRAPTYPGLMTTYTLELRHFPAGEAARIIGVMSSEFPGYSSHDILTTTSAVRKYEYVTTASAAKLHEWLTILLADMGVDPDRNAEIHIAGGRISVDRITTPDPAKPARRGRFQ